MEACASSSSQKLEVEVDVQDFFNDGRSLSLPSEEINGIITAETWQQWFHCWLEALQPNIPLAVASATSAYELSLRLTNNAEIQDLNAQYRHQNQPTDVLAFAALELDYPQPAELLASQPLYLGDIAISVETAYQQAKQQGHSLKTELAWLAVHGLLHLLGWDHPDEDSLTQMLNQQETLLGIIGLSPRTSYLEYIY